MGRAQQKPILVHKPVTSQSQGKKVIWGEGDGSHFLWSKIDVIIERTQTCTEVSFVPTQKQPSEEKENLSIAKKSLSYFLVKCELTNKMQQSEITQSSVQKCNSNMPTYMGKGALDANGNRVYVDIELPR